MHDHDYSEAPNVVNLSEIKKASVSYIAGYVGTMTEKKNHVCLAVKHLVQRCTQQNPAS